VVRKELEIACDRITARYNIYAENFKFEYESFTTHKRRKGKVQNCRTIGKYHALKRKKLILSITFVLMDNQKYSIVTG